ncbi:hypothetical protein Q4E93_27220 [Flavitalea sp. BT771]|uniref:hypothetical protein n=1 Tax=Flavitalea sp. BT771 TaxID=3063329 RepID=UPI0026E1D8AD|nr:hypothetical protein [Flavitalea sp. BT771]MDO6434332.1 hypothetical protein [Flavitalea sp. BT771]MDV6223232.1 hypothetical protein [Flavitalea sp. BT771]
MKIILLQLCIACIAFTAQAQETNKPQLPPVRTSDPVRRLEVVRTAIPLKGGDHAQQPKTVQPEAVQPKATRMEAVQTVAVPVRKADAAPAASSAGGTQDKATKGKADVTLPSSLSGKQAREQQQQAAQQPPAAGAPKP